MTGPVAGESLEKSRERDPINAQLDCDLIAVLQVDGSGGGFNSRGLLFYNNNDTPVERERGNDDGCWLR